MNVRFKILLIGSLIVFPVFSTIADDDSCELKKSDHSSMSDSSTNEFTIDKTWRFKINDDLLKDGSAQNRVTENNHLKKKVQGDFEI